MAEIEEVNPTKTISREEAMQALREENAKSIQACNQEIAIVLQKHGCMLIPRIEFIGTQVQANVAVVKNPQGG